MWDQLKRQMPLCNSVHDLELAVRDLWALLPQDNIRCLINSMPDRVAVKHGFTNTARNKSTIKKRKQRENRSQEKTKTVPSVGQVVTGSGVFSVACPLGSLGTEFMATLFQQNPRSEV
ncbi:hypothetical protein TNCV_3037661 [Trichonephila clavipes]|nr:hypothetical protein TNCV_3037661 [Trichonephila clavipes]